MARWYCEMCDRWFGRGGACRACGYQLRAQATEPPDPDGEAFRGGEAAAYAREQQADAQRVK